MKNGKLLFFWPVLVIGIALVVMPFAMSMPSKAGAGQDMLDNFRPIMQPANVSKTADYYNNTFVNLRPVAEGGPQLAAEAPQLIAALAQQLNMSPEQVQQFLGSQFPAMAGLLGGLPQLLPTFANVPPGLDHYKPLVDVMQANVTNYEQVDSLPSFRLFTWFFVIPGILLILLAGIPLAMGLKRGAGTTA
ncbi:MAG TPA: hypothetical protein VJP78_06845 [Thermoleophilia bacterium]|nr:hypothetical protein [Thermoleophilia bacterium]